MNISSSYDQWGKSLTITLVLDAWDIASLHKATEDAEYLRRQFREFLRNECIETLAEIARSEKPT